MTKTLPVRLRGLTKPTDREWLVMVAYGWARGNDLLKVAREACNYGAHATPAKGAMVVLHVAPGTVVNGMGSVVWTPAPDASPDGLEDANEPVRVAGWEK